MRALLPLVALIILLTTVYLSLILWGLVAPVMGNAPGVILGVLFYKTITSKLRIRKWGNI